MAKLLTAILVLVAIGLVCVEANKRKGDTSLQGTEDFVEKNEKCFDGFDCPDGSFPYNFDGNQGCTEETTKLCPDNEVFSIVDGKLFCTREVTIKNLCGKSAPNFYFFDGIYGCSTGSP